MSSTSTQNEKLSRRDTAGADNFKKVMECIEISKKEGRKNVPSSCEPYLKDYEHQEAAWSGASFFDRVVGTSSHLLGLKNPFRVEKDYVDPTISNPTAKDEPPH